MRQYVVKPGDTVLRIAARYELAKEQLMTANPWISRQPYIKPGQIMFLPSSFRKRYMVMDGDTPESVAASFQCEVCDLEAINPGLSLYRFTPGKTIALPPVSGGPLVQLQGEYGPRECAEDLLRLTSRYSCMTVEQIGASVLGTPIQALRLGSGNRALHVHGALHGNEWITAPCLLRFAEQYASAWTRGSSLLGHDVTEWFRQYTLWLVPMVNPDGVELVQQGVSGLGSAAGQLLEWNGGRENFRKWKANIRGVDLGDQFPAHWEQEVERRGKSGPAPQDYPGPAPLSEPEARGLYEHTLSIQPERVISWHSQGQEIYWNYRSCEPEYSEQWAHRLAQAAGYRAVKLSGSDAGYKDWFIQHYRKPGFTVELGRGINPLPLEDFEDLAFETTAIMAAFMSLA
ncbi:LysM peptidoglycan-binding domain-containing protein [Paenibacillus sp. F411]|uniref:M14 family metallopeptidase n=1 Tax=Paenibacillus sp. F411 TaxID=2820239 RepID=UPI001AAE62E4|nr:M14 family metallopeptidase [Paenibacillus sp. F411]MBO2942547.1 LysM peptidoglycan-binding domain-containing protein [Paenibacillus sp. F411]